MFVTEGTARQLTVFVCADLQSCIMFVITARFVLHYLEFKNLS